MVFDLDGTLVDSAPDLVATLNLLLRQARLPALAPAVARPMIGQGARALIEKGFAAAGAPASPEALDALFDRFIAHYRAHIADHSRPFDGAERALANLRDSGARLAVCTNKRTDLSEALLGALGLSHFFEAVIGGDLVAACKPDPDHLLATVERAGGRADRALMVGDSGTDAGAARAAGIPLVLVSFGYTETPAADLGADILIDRFSDLPQACATLAGLFAKE